MASETKTLIAKPVQTIPKLQYLAVSIFLFVMEFGKI